MADFDLDSDPGEFENCCQLLRDTVRLYQTTSYLHQFVALPDNTYADTRARKDTTDSLFLRQLDIYANSWGKNLFFVVMNDVFPQLNMTQEEVEMFVDKAQRNVFLLREYHQEKIIPLLHFSYAQTGEEIIEPGKNVSRMELNLTRSEKDLSNSNFPLGCDDIFSIFQILKCWSFFKDKNFDVRTRFGYETNYTSNSFIRYKGCQEK